MLEAQSILAVGALELGVKFGGQCHEICVKLSVQQGSRLGPVLFLLFINDIKSAGKFLMCEMI